MFLTIKELDDFGSRFPMVALRHLRAAQNGMPVPPSENPKKHRYNKRRMQVVEDAVMSIIAAGVAIETEVLALAVFSYFKIERGKMAGRAPDFGKLFALAKKDKPPLEKGKLVNTKGGEELHRLGRDFTKALGASPCWPANASVVRKERNRLVHNTIVPRASSWKPDSTVLTLLEDEDVEKILRSATDCFEIMCACLACCKDARKKISSKETQTLENAVAALLRSPEAERRDVAPPPR